MVQWDPTVRAGDLITAVTVLAALVAAYIRIRERLIDLEIKVGSLWPEYQERRTIVRRGVDRRARRE